MTSLSGRPFSALHESTMNGSFVPTAGPATAVKARAKRQSPSLTNRNARDLFGINFLSNAAGCKAVFRRIQARRQRGKIIFQKSLASLAGQVKFALPNENWAPRRVSAI
jgi:NAD(P)-dependent dehydrogenase (short-subunit alcohol dehydrogenase family)